MSSRTRLHCILFRAREPVSNRFGCLRCYCIQKSCESKTKCFPFLPILRPCGDVADISAVSHLPRFSCLFNVFQAAVKLQLAQIFGIVICLLQHVGALYVIIQHNLLFHWVLFTRIAIFTRSIIDSQGPLSGLHYSFTSLQVYWVQSFTTFTIFNGSTTV